MRLLLSGLILLVTVLNMNFGSESPRLQIAGMSAGVLLALTVILDFLWLDRPHRSTDERTAELNER